MVIADHISAQALTTMHLVKEGSATGEVIGHTDHEGLQILVVSVNGVELTGDGTPFHISWSAEQDAKTRESGAVVKRNGFTRFAQTIPLDLFSGPSYSAPLRTKPEINSLDS